MTPVGFTPILPASKQPQTPHLRPRGQPSSKLYGPCKNYTGFQLTILYQLIFQCIRKENDGGKKEGKEKSKEELDTK
jgi:hypothetical protein